MTSQRCEQTANEMGRRILALIPANPSILTMDGPFGLHAIPGFECDDLQPSLAQASAALGWARNQYRKTSAAK